MPATQAMGKHDQFFKHIFRVPVHAAGELRSVLPEDLVEVIDFGSLALVPSDLVSQKLNERFADATFRARFRGVRGYVRLLLEHQSEPEHFMVLRVLEHLVRSWFEFLRNNPKAKAVPPYVCVIVHHGERGWTPPTRLHEVIRGLGDVPGLESYVPKFQIIVDDLVTTPDSELKSRPLTLVSRVSLWALRDARVIRRFYAHLGAWASDLSQLATEFPEDAAAVMRYILEVAGDESFERVQQKIIEAVPIMEPVMNTVAHELIQRGKALGRAEGIEEGQAKAKAEALLAVFVARGFQLDDAQRTRIIECRDLSLLDRWFSRSLHAERAADVFVP
jgi:predicted transposase YdaD